MHVFHAQWSQSSGWHGRLPDASYGQDTDGPDQSVPWRDTWLARLALSAVCLAAIVLSLALIAITVRFTWAILVGK